MKKEVKIRDVAEAAGVSCAAVSLVMNDGKIRISDEKRQAIHEAAKKLGYRPNNSARRLAIGKTDTLGLVFPHNAEALSHYFLFELTRNIAQSAKSHRYDLLLDFMNTGKPDANILDSSRTDGMIVVLDRNRAPLESGIMESYRHPCMAIGGAFQEHPPRDYVDADIQHGSFAATSHLIELGHKRIAFLAGVHSPWKQKGYENALKVAGIAVDPELIMRCEMHAAEILEAVREFVQKRPVPTAVVVTNDVLAIRVIRNLNELGLTVPGDVSVVGFDDIEPAQLFTPTLTTVKIPIYDMSEYAVSGLIRRIKDKDADPIQKILPTSLIVRNSSGPAPSI
jgi:DNA-binding LacI/PurR family transcriptional regulator